MGTRTDVLRDAPLVALEGVPIDETKSLYLALLLVNGQLLLVEIEGVAEI